MFLAILKRAKKEFAARPPAKVELKESTLGPESPVPEGALVLRVYSRITPLPAGLGELQRRRNGQLGRDHLWLPKSDAAEILSRLKVINMLLRLPDRHSSLEMTLHADRVATLRR